MRLAPLLLAAGSSFALCPFKRGDHEIPDEELARLLAETKHHVPAQDTADRVKRSTPFDREAQLIDVSGEHAWQPPGPNDMYVKTSISQTALGADKSDEVLARG